MTTTYLPDYPEAGFDDASPQDITVTHAPVDRAFRSVTRIAGRWSW